MVPQNGNDKLDLTVWHDRWDAVNAIIGTMVKSYGGSSVATKKDILCPLLDYFQQFATQHFNFFVGRCENGDLNKSAEYPFNYVLRATLEQIESDLEVIRQAADQRTAFPNVSSKIETADRLVYLALRPAVKGDLFQQPTAITYFGTSLSIRVIPYASAALVRVPFTCGSTDLDYLAIPHEVGHYVFWNGRSGPTKKHIHESLREATTGFKCKRWLEEIFADVYGGLVGGPALALDFQELQVESSQNGFDFDDNVHPKPSVRPQIHTRLFNRLGLPRLQDVLERNWQIKTVDRPRPEPERATAGEAEIPDLIELADLVIDKTFEFLPKSLFQSHGWWNWPESSEGVETVDLSFEVDKLAKRVTKKELATTPKQMEWETWAGEFFNEGQGPVPRTGPVKVDEWRELLKAHGWATKGPHGVW